MDAVSCAESFVYKDVAVPGQSRCERGFVLCLARLKPQVFEKYNLAWLQVIALFLSIWANSVGGKFDWETHQFGQTVVMVTHDAHAATYADRIIFLKDGRIAHDCGHLGRDDIYDVIKSLEKI